MSRWMDIGETIGSTGNMGSFARTLLLKQLMAGESEQSARRKAVIGKAVEKSTGVIETDGIPHLTDEAKKIYSPEEGWAALGNYAMNKLAFAEASAKSKEASLKLLETVTTEGDKNQKALEDDPGWATLPQDAKDAKRLVVAQRMHGLLQHVFGNTYLAKYGLDKVADKLGTMSNKDVYAFMTKSIADQSIAKMIKGKGTTQDFINYQSAYNAQTNLVKQTMFDMEYVKKNFIPADIQKMQDDRKRQEEQMKADVQKAKEKEMVDYRAKVEKPTRYQLIGTTNDGKPVSYDSGTGKNVVDGKEYVGPIKPKTTNPEIVNREANKLRIEFNKLPEVKNYKDIVFRHDVMNEAMLESKRTKNFVAVDQALITSFNKMTDPTSVVRESEYLRTASDLALMNRLKGKVAKLGSGGAGLTQDDRKALFTMAVKFKQASERKYKASLHEYKGYLANYGVDPEQYLKPAAGEKTVLETRITKDGKKLIKYSDGTIGEEK